MPISPKTPQQLSLIALWAQAADRPVVRQDAQLFGRKEHRREVVRSSARGNARRGCRPVMAVRHVAVRDVGERGDQRGRIGGAPHPMTHPVRVGDGQQRLAASRLLQQVAQALRRAEGKQHRLRMGAEGAHVAYAVVLLRGACAFVRADQPAPVVGGAHARDDAGLPVRPVLHPVQVEFRLPFPDQDALLLQVR